MRSLYQRAEQLELELEAERFALTAVHSTSAAFGRRVLLLHALVPSRHARKLHELRLEAEQRSAFMLAPNAGHMLRLTHPELVAEHARAGRAHD